MHVFDFRLRSCDATNHPIRVMSQADIPEMFMQSEQ